MSLIMNAVSTSPKNSLTDDFVMVSNSPSSSPPVSSSIEVVKESLASKGYSEQASSDFLPRSASEKPKDNEIFEKFVSLVKENEELKETLKHNTSTLQKHINDFAEMQEQYKQTNEAIKKEHQKAKEVVTKLRNENKSLKEQLKSVQHENGETLRKENELAIERENAFLKQQISTLQEQIAHIDNEIKDNQFTEAAVENWQQLLGSIASYEFQTGTLFSGLEKRHEFNSEMKVEDTSSLEGRYAKLETEKEILNVDLDKLKLEKNHMEKQLLEMLEENKKLQTRFEHAREEKEELRKMLNEHMEKDAESNKDQQEQKEMVRTLNVKIESLTEELQKETQKNKDAEEERKKSATEYDTQLKMKEEEFKQKLRDVELECLKKIDDNDDSVSKEKYETVKDQYIKYQGQVHKLEDEKKELQDKLKPLEEQKNKLQEELKNVEKDKEEAEKQLLESRKQMEAELESRSETYGAKLVQLHSELEEGRNREEHNLKQLENLQEEIEECKRREIMLQERLGSLQTVFQEKDSAQESLQDQVCHLIEENESFKVKNDKLTELNARRDKLYDERVQKMERDRHIKENELLSIIDMLKAQLGSAKEENKKYLEQYQVSRMEQERLESHNEALLKEYDELINSFEEDRNKRDDARAEIDDYKRQLDFLTAERSCFEEAVHKKEHQINELMEELKVLQPYKEDVPILKQQLEVYRNDFQAERESRERQHADLLRQQEECERLRMENEDLQRELDNLANNQMAEMQRRHGSHVPHHSVMGLVNQQGFRSGFYRRGGEPDPREGAGAGSRSVPGNTDEQREDPYQCHGCRQNFVRFSELQAHVGECPAALHGNGPPQPGGGNSQPYCPKCGNEFPDLDTLQIHVLECLDTD